MVRSFSWAKKTAAVNLSDLAAMGGIPERAHLALALPRAFPKRSLQQFIRGLVGVWSTTARPWWVGTPTPRRVP